MIAVAMQQAVGRESQVVKCRAYTRQVIAALFGECQSAVLANEEFDAEFFLEPLDLMTNGGLRDV